LLDIKCFGPSIGGIGEVVLCLGFDRAGGRPTWGEFNKAGLRAQLIRTPFVFQGFTGSNFFSNQKKKTFFRGWGRTVMAT